MSVAESPESSAVPLSLEELESRITELAAHIYAATYRWLCLLREFDERQGWVGWGIHCCAHWLNWKCGVGIGAAREKLRVAHALKRLPLVSAAFERGELSYSKVRALTRIADASNEELLLSVALGGTASHVETLVRAYRRCKRVDELKRAERQHRDRYLRCYHDEDGALVIEARLPSEQGALVLKALEAAMDVESEERWRSQPVDKIPAETSSTGTDVPSEPFETFGARRADALAKLAETYLATGAKELNGFAVTRLDDGAFVFTRPPGTTIPAWQKLPAVDPLRGVESLNHAAGLHVDANTCIPNWLGEKRDLHAAVMCLYQCEERKIESDSIEAPRPS